MLYIIHVIYGLTRQYFGTRLGGETASAYDLHLQMAFAVSDTELDLAQARRAQYLSTHQLGGTQALDEVSKLTLGAKTDTRG